MEFADLDLAATDISLKLLKINLHLVDILLKTVDIVAKEDSIGSELANVGFQLCDSRPKLIDVGPQKSHIDVDAAGDGALCFKFATDVVVLTVPTIDVVILSQDAGTKVGHARIQMVDAVMEM